MHYYGILEAPEIVQFLCPNWFAEAFNIIVYIALRNAQVESFQVYSLKYDTIIILINRRQLCKSITLAFGNY